MVKAFLNWHNAHYGTALAVEHEPDPPDAILRDGSSRTWVELATVFASDEWAQDVMSSITPGEQHVSVSGRVFTGIDATFVDRFVNIVKKKRCKTSYIPFKEQYGPGILLLDLHSPWFRAEVLPELRDGYEQAEWTGDIGCFNRIFVGYVLPVPSDGRMEFQAWTHV